MGRAPFVAPTLLDDNENQTQCSGCSALVGIQLGYQTAVLIIANIANCITLHHYNIILTVTTKTECSDRFGWIWILKQRLLRVAAEYYE